MLSGAPQAGGGVRHRRWHIARVYLLDAQRFRTKLEARGVRIGNDTSVRVSDLQPAEIYPTSGPDALLTLTEAQRQALSLFA